jgi:seryl-tRNA synthetase
MLDIKLFRETPDIVRKDLKKRKYADKLPMVDEIITTDNDWRKSVSKRDELKNKRNIVSKEISIIKDIKLKQKKINEMQDNNKKIAKIEKKCNELEKKVTNLLCQIPNIMDENVPVGKDDSENVKLYSYGKKPKFNFTPKRHQDLCEKNDWYDLIRGAKVAGARGYYLKNDLAQFEHAIIQYAIGYLRKKGFTVMTVPYFCYDKCFYSTGFLPYGKEDIYKIENEPFSLIGTSEVPLVSYHMDETLLEKELPIKFGGFSACFRTEAGSHGKDEKGIFRVHQFNKIEMVVLSKPEESAKMFDNLLKIAEEFWQSLGIHYRVVNICTGDLGVTASKKFDIEAWFPGQNRYREVNSCSNIKTYQSKRANIKYREEEGKAPKGYVHTLNNTLIAVPRGIIPMLEQFQTKEGKVLIPKILQSYMGGKEFLE